MKGANMSTVRSYVKYEKQFEGQLKSRLGLAESDTDAQSLFFQTVRDMLREISANKLELEFSHLHLILNQEPHYSFSDELLSQPEFQNIFQDSDLSAILERFALATVRCCMHLGKHPEKTESRVAKPQKMHHLHG